MQLFQHDQLLCEVTQFEYQSGETPIRYIHQIGGPPVAVKGRATPDIIHLLLSRLPQFQGNLAEIREGEQSRQIMITSINATNSGGVIVHAIGL